MTAIRKPDTAEELAIAVMALVEDRDHVSFAELARYWPEHFQAGEDGNKDEAFEIALDEAPNIILWSGLSKLGIDAMNIVRPKTDLDLTNLLTYAVDGMWLALPIAKGKSRKALMNLKKPHWAPCVLRPKRCPLEAARRETQ